MEEVSVSCLTGPCNRCPQRSQSKESSSYPHTGHHHTWSGSCEEETGCPAESSNTASHQPFPCAPSGTDRQQLHLPSITGGHFPAQQESPKGHLCRLPTQVGSAPLWLGPSQMSRTHVVVGAREEQRQVRTYE